MNKSTLFTLFLAAFLVVVIAELLADNYVKNPQTLQTSSLQEGNNSQEPVGTSPTPATPSPLTSPSPVTPEPPAVPISPEPEKVEPEVSVTTTNSPPTTEKSPLINFELITKAGFEGVSLQRVVFKGMLFGMLDINELISMPAIEQNVLKNNAAAVANFVEFSTDDESTARDLYQLFQQKAKGQLGATVNETNGFRSNSFYVNYLEYPQRVFLVVRAKKNVYALTYQKEYHASVTQLIQSLP